MSRELLRRVRGSPGPEEVVSHTVHSKYSNNNDGLQVIGKEGEKGDAGERKGGMD